MTLDDLKARITVGTVNDATLQVKLDDAIDFVCGYLNNWFISEDMPNRVKSIVAKYVDSNILFAENTGVKSESIGGMSQTFETSEERDKALKKELRDTGLRRVVW